MTKNLIIAVFSRDYSWISELDNNIKKTIYTKNESDIKPNEILIKPNVGRCVHTFFNHIYKEYDNLDDYTITSQDYPFDHIDNYIEIINGDITTWNNLAKQKVGECWFFCTEYPLLQSSMNGSPHHAGLDIPSVWSELFNEPIPNSVTFTAAGHFIISREQVHKRPREFYGKICNILSTNNQSPWIIERLESSIFDENLKIKL
jgi:hypothetical protein